MQQLTNENKNSQKRGIDPSPKQQVSHPLTSTLPLPLPPLTNLHRTRPSKPRRRANQKPILIIQPQALLAPQPPTLIPPPLRRRRTHPIPIPIASPLQPPLSHILILMHRKRKLHPRRRHLKPPVRIHPQVHILLLLPLNPQLEPHGTPRADHAPLRGPTTRRTIPPAPASIYGTPVTQTAPAPRRRHAKREVMPIPAAALGGAEYAVA
ncbi:hypothetical protein B0T16DRAFT_405473 [Cercophora newfieldiana]|uniref:Uncharacterized protein n=1 Tax=Cercophora newfieldiana TaxID=92897 RepID=A0AA39YGB8_9PEZI|nr:hypothetical protein B0T16DRAFT_405473 [Cercophora newfieldiana]